MSQHILIVEDDLPILLTVADVLEQEGYLVRVATNGMEGMEGLELNPPALVLLDMRMPRCDGWAFAREIARRGLSVPIVVMTAARDARAWAAEIGAAGYLAKPFELDQLLTAVRRLVPHAGHPAAS